MHQVNDEYHELLSGPGGLYLGIDNEYSVVRIDPATDTVKENIALGKGGGYGAGEIALDGDSLWAVDQYSNFLHRLSSSPLAAQAEFPFEDRYDGELTAGAGSVFIEDIDGQRVGFFDPATGKLTQEIEVGGGVEKLAVQEGVLVVALSYTGDGSVLLIDPKSGKQLKDLQGVYADDFAFE